MVRKSRARSSSLFLMELILAIFFFSVASGVCVQFFVRSHLLSRESDALNHAVSECSGIAEALCTTDGAAGAVSLLTRLYPDAHAGESELGIYYNEAFEPCAEESAAYLLTVLLSETDQMLDASMQMRAYRPADGSGTASSADTGAAETPEDDVIYELNIRHHIARKTD